MVSVTNGPLFGNSGFDDLTVVELPEPRGGRARRSHRRGLGTGIAQ